MSVCLMYVYDEDYILHLFSRKLIYAKDILDSKFNLILNADHQSLFCKNNDKFVDRCKYETIFPMNITDPNEQDRVDFSDNYDFLS